MISYSSRNTNVIVFLHCPDNDFIGSFFFFYVLWQPLTLLWVTYSLWFYATLFVMILVICLTNKKNKRKIIIMIYWFNYEMPTFQWDNILAYVVWDLKGSIIDCISTQTQQQQPLKNVSPSTTRQLCLQH